MAASPSPALPLEVLNNTIGALEAGGMIACLLMGIVTIQVYYYFSKYPEDHIATKLLVSIVWICELGHSICICHTIYISTVTSWSNPLVFVNPPKTLSTAILFSALSTPLVQSFFAYRIKGVAKAWPLTIICWLMSLARTVFAFVSFAEGVNMVTLQEYLKDWKWAIMATLIVGAANDMLIALSLIWVLMQQRHLTTAKSTVAIIDTLIVWTLETGLLTSMAGVIMMILFLVMPDNFIWLSFFTFLVKLYSNSLLAVLNGRDSLREKNGTAIVELSYPATRSNLSGNTTLNERSRDFNSRHIQSESEFTGKRTPYDSLPGKFEPPETKIYLSREVVTK